LKTSVASISPGAGASTVTCYVLRATCHVLTCYVPGATCSRPTCQVRRAHVRRATCYVPHVRRARRHVLTSDVPGATCSTCHVPCVQRATCSRAPRQTRGGRPAPDPSRCRRADVSDRPHPSTATHWLPEVERLHALLQTHGDAPLRTAFEGGLAEQAVGGEYIAHCFGATIPPLPFDDTDRPPTIRACRLPRGGRVQSAGGRS
jgi:hypothetical protein